MNYREKRGAYLNCEKRMFDGVGRFEMPELNPVQVDLTEPKVIGFNYAIGGKDTRKTRSFISSLTTISSRGSGTIRIGICQC